MSRDGSQPSSDPIARNPKDADGLSVNAQGADVHRAGEGGAQLANAAWLHDGPWALGQRAPTAPSSSDLLTSVLRFKWTLLIVAFVVSAPIVALIWTQTVPRYQARAEVRVRPIIPRLVFRTEENGMIPLYDSFVNTQVSIARSMVVLQRVLDQRDVRESQWYKEPARSFLQRLRGGTTPAMERLRDGLTVRPRSQTEIVDVSFQDRSAKEAMLIVNAVLDQYIKYIAETSDATEDTLYRQLVDQYRALENEIQSREKVCTQLYESLGTETPQELVSSQRLRLDQIQGRLSDLRNSISLLEWEMNQTGAGTGDPNDGSAALAAGGQRQPRYDEDMEWRRLDMDVRTIQHQIAVSAPGPNHPEGIRMRKNLEFAQELRHVRETQLDEQRSEALRHPLMVSSAVADANGPRADERAMPVEYQLARAQREEQLVLAELDNQQEQFKRVFEGAQLLEKENAALRSKRELFDAVRQRLDQKNMERNVPGSIEVLTRAFAPSDPEQDRRAVLTAMILCLGVGVGGGAAFLRASRNQAIYTARDMPQPVQVPFLGQVPLLPTRKPSGKAAGDGAADDQLLLTESIRLVRTALLSHLTGQDSATVLVTSATAGTGKSSFSVVLAKSMAHVGKKVLLIDADFHKRSLSKQFDLLEKPGFIDALSSRSVTPGQIFPMGTPGLSVMPAGTRGDDEKAFEEIANGAFKACMSQLSLHCNYDVILLDSPPILSGADATIIAGQVNGTIMVEREHLSRRTDVLEALTRLGSARGRLMGTVFVGSSDHEGHGLVSGCDR